MVKRFITTIIISFSCLIVKSQTIADINSPKLVSPAPDAAALGKYAQIPVDKSTGIPGISIPIYEIKTPRFSLPISLSYHASGIKVDEMASWVGTGWSLNAGGVITRSIVNMPDDASFLYNTLPTFQQLGTPSMTYLESVAQHQIDTQPDNFFFNFAGESGAFVFGTDSAKTPVTIPYKPVKIKYNPNATVSPAGNFTITDENGNSYYFNDRESTVSNANTYSSGVTSWYLSKMVSADKTDTISFVYQKDPADLNQFFKNFSQLFTYSLNEAARYPEAPHLYEMKQSTTINNVPYPIHIQTILFKGGKVDFVAKTGRADGANVSLDSITISNFDFALKKYSKLKSFKINTGYWYNPLRLPDGSSMGAAYDYRLKLDSVVELNQNNIAIKTHKFGYNSVLLPPQYFYAQDHWGYYNGKNSNSSLLEQKKYFYEPNTYLASSADSYTAGSADRSTDPSYIKAGMLEKIIYPTKGFTLFDYECHKFLNYPSLVTDSTIAFATGYYHETATFLYTPTQATIDSRNGVVNFRIYLKNNTYGYEKSYVRVTRVSDGAQIYNSYSQSGVNINQYISLTLVAGTQYRVTAVAMGGTQSTQTSTLPQASISTTFQVQPPPAIANGGGLRIKSIKNYNADGTIVNTETYKYGTSENGVGLLMNDSLAFFNYVNRLNFRDFYDPSTTQPNHYTRSYQKIFTSNSTYSLSTLNGSPISYSSVTVYNGDTVSNVGKSVYQYANYPDSIRTVDVYYQNGILLLPRTWKNGQILREAHYRNSGSNQFQLVQEKLTSYYDSYRTPVASFRTPQAVYVGYRYENENRWESPYNGNTSGPPDNPSYPTLKYIYFSYPISSGVRVPSQTITTNYASDGVTQQQQDTLRYYYNNFNHMYPTKLDQYDGKGNVLSKQVSYPQDITLSGNDPTGIYQSMVDANMISLPIVVAQLKNTTPIIKSVTNYGTFNTNLIKPVSVELQKGNSSSEVRLQYNSYDKLGNVQTLLKAGGPTTTYLWGYNSQYPIAEIKNASYQDVLGVLGQTTIDQLAAGTSLTDMQIRSLLNPLLTSTSLKNAQVTTYTYNPLVGMTSSTDSKGMTTTYEYDSFQRLMNVKDKDGNIVKHNDYHYQNQ